MKKRNSEKSMPGPAQQAKEARLVYVTDSVQGITRKKSGRVFHYFHEQRRIAEASVLERIRKLVIPPAWKEVWICPLPNGHLQATGKDNRNRKQYLYHPDWHRHRNETKFSRM